MVWDKSLKWWWLGGAKGGGLVTQVVRSVKDEVSDSLGMGRAFREKRVGFGWILGQKGPFSPFNRNYFLFA